MLDDGSGMGQPIPVRTKESARTTFKDLNVKALDRDVLARQAHILVSRAGMLGFSELAQLCGVLEQACKRGEALGPPLLKARTAALQRAASQLLQNLNGHTPDDQCSNGGSI